VNVKMIPPIAPSILTANPQFALLNKHLSTQLLNPDASTKSTSTRYEPVAQKLKQHHIQAAQHDILKRTLRNMVADETLPPELVELIITIATYLAEAPGMALSDEAHDLMAPEVEAFQSSLHILAPILSSHMQRERDALLPLVSSSTSASSTKLTSPPTSLTTNLTTRLTTLQTHHTTTLPTATNTLSNTLSTLLTVHTTHLATQIRHLELHTHGTLARYTSARATHLSTVAAGLEAKLRILALQAEQALYTPALQRALAAYSAHLREFRSRLSEREELLGRELDLYEDVAGDGLKECARRYRVVAREIEVVKGEIARLEDEMGMRVGRTRTRA
jgi:diphthamide biosynthesis protein 3